MNIGFLGLGNLGTAIACRLISQGYSLTVWNRTQSRADSLGVPVASSPRRLIASCDTVFVCLFDSQAVRAVLSGPEGLLAGCRGRTIIDLSTNHHRDVINFHDQVGDAGGSYLEAPVLGSVVPASQGSLTVLVSGREDVFLRCKPLFESIGKSLFHLPPPGLATRLKLINNFLLGTFMTGIANALVLAEAAGTDRTAALDIFGAGAGNSAVLSAKREKLINREFSPHFSAALIHKDLTFLAELADELGVANSLGNTVLSLYERTLIDDPHHRDFAVVYEVFRRGLR